MRRAQQPTRRFVLKLVSEKKFQKNLTAIDSADSQSAVQMMKDTQIAVDEAFWPLYRWVPAVDGTFLSRMLLVQFVVDQVSSSFTLDSEKLRAEIDAFLKRDNQLTAFIGWIEQFAGCNVKVFFW